MVCINKLAKYFKEDGNHATKPIEKRESTKTIGKRSKGMEKVSRQIREYTEEKKWFSMVNLLKTFIIT